GNKPTDYDQKDIEAVSLLADLAWEIAERKLAEDLLRAERGLFVCGPTVIFKWRAREGWPVEYVSPNVLDQFGYTPQDFTSGKVPYATIIHPDDLERVATEVNTYSKQGVTSFEQVYRIIHRNGTYRWIDDFTSVITDRDGNIANFLGYILDITERKLAEKALQESEQKYRTLIQKIQAAVIVHSADTQIITCNTKAQQLLGISEDQLLGKTVIDPAWHFFHEDNSIMGLEDYPANKVFATKKELRNYIVGVHRPNNTNDVWVLVNADPVFDTSDQLSQVIVTFIDITERKLAEKNLLKASEDIHDLYNHAPCGYHSLNKDGLVVQMNDTELEWLGYRREEVVGKIKFTELFTEKSLKNFEHNFPKFKTTGLIQNLEFDLIRKNGSIFTILLSATAIYDQEGNFQMSRSTVTDITELKKSEKALEESNRHYHQIVDLSQDMIVIHQHGKVVFINDAGVKLVGASKPEDIIGRSVLDFVPQNLKEVAKKRIVSGLTGGELKSPIYEQKLLRLDGIVIDIDLRGMNIQYHGDGAIQFVARDITDRKQAEAKLIESEQKFRSLAEGSPDNIIRYDTGCRAVYINRNMYLTISPEVAANIGKTPTEGSQYPGIIDYETKLRKVIQTGRPDEMEFDVPNPNGELRTHHIRFVAEQNNDGAIIGAIAIGRDITDRKQSELALQEREKHSRSLLRLSRKFEIAQDYDEILLAAFEEVQKIIGYKNLWAYQITEDKKYAISLAAHGSVSGIIMSDTGTGRLTIQGDQMLEAIANAVDIIIIEDAQTDERVNKEIVARLKNRTIVNVPIVLFDRHLGSIGMGTFGDEGVLIPTQPQEEFLKALASQMAVSFDRIHLANRRNQVEEALRISEESFRRLVEYSPVSMAVWSGIDGRVILFNKKFTELFGYTIEDIPDVAHWWTVAYPDKAYRESQMQLWAKLNDGTEPLDNHKPTEAIITGKDGTPRNIELRISNSHQDKSLVTLIDRTEQKLAEEKLRNTAQRLNEAQRLAHIGSWELDLVNNVLIWSDEIYRMFEIDPNKFSATYEAFLDAIHPDDREAVNIAYTRSLKTRTTYAIDHRIVYSDGRVKYVHEQCETYYDGDKPTRSIGTVQDITERKQAEEALRESELKYREIFDNVLDSLFLLEVTDDGHFRNLEVNPAFEKSTGIARTQLIGKVIEETVPKNVADIVNAKYHRCVEAGIPIEEEAELDLPTGRRYFHSTLIPARNEIGRIHRIIGISRDITDRKKAEDALRESEAKFFTVFQLSPMALSITSIKDQVFLDVNNSFLQNVGYKRDELIGKSSNILDLWADHGLWDKFRQIMADKGKIDNFEFEFRGKPGKYGYGLISATIVTINGAPCVLSQIANINDRKAMEEKIRTLNRELERRIFERTAQLESANKELEAFAYSVSHDLRAPLRGIDGFCQVLFDEYKGNMDEAGKNYLMRIRAAAQRMGQLIDDMLELSRISRSEMKIHQVDLSNIANEITNELNESAPGRKVNFSIQNGIQVNGDGRLLRIVLENLMGNAWKFTSKHSKASIMFGMQIVDGNPAYFVSDDGAGFDMNYAQKLFGAFQRLHTAKEFEGTGIGLATVQRIVHRHGGKVWAKGEVEKGATFYFTIP
ncbi:MAG TPA: hypothetical protein DCY97_08055, partial [Marinilabiliales bacterium]|nr:hypothetical protein [Marinilabiliales bacterium]